MPSGPIFFGEQSVMLSANFTKLHSERKIGGKKIEQEWSLPVLHCKGLCSRPALIGATAPSPKSEIGQIERDESRMRKWVSFPGLCAIFALLAISEETPKYNPDSGVAASPDGLVAKACPAGAPCPKGNVTLSLSANRRDLCQGETARISASLGGGNAGPLTYAWTVNGQPAGEGQSLLFAAAGKNRGTYDITLNVNGANVNLASATTTIAVNVYRPPKGFVKAHPARIYSGEKARLSAGFQGQCGGPVQAPAFTASEGSVRGGRFDSAGVRFDPANKAEQRRIVTIRASAADRKNIGIESTDIEVIKKAEVEAIRLPDVMFSANDARVNNCGKRILLEKLRSYTDRDSEGAVVLLGYNSSDEQVAGLDRQRALNAAAVITAGTGVCLSIPRSQVQVGWSGPDPGGIGFESGFCASSVRAGSSITAKSRRVAVWFVPTGAQPPALAAKHREAASLPVEPVGCPR